MNPIFSASLAAVAIAAAATLWLPARSHASEAGHQTAMWKFVTGALLVLLACLNASMWLPSRAIHVFLLILAAYAIVRIARNRSFLAPPSTLATVAAAVVALAAAVLTLLVRADSWWLLEGPNHDSLFYFEGAAWAWAHGTYASPELVAHTWGLGGCRQGAVFIGSDCVGYRGGTYALLALANGRAQPTSGNAVQILAGFAALLPALGLFPFARRMLSTSGWRRLLPAAAVVSGAMLILLSPGLLGALENANLGTVFGSASLCMALGLAVAPCDSPMRRAFTLGLAAAVAGHFYGEATIPAGYIAASGVLMDSVRLRRAAHAFMGGAVAIVGFLAGLNVVAVELVESFTAIHALAQGGEWAGWYLDGPAWSWLAAPFSGLLLGAMPIVTPHSLYIGATLGGTVFAAGLMMRGTRLATIAVLVLNLVLVAYVEYRDYAYGEHKILQLLGPVCYMFAAVVAGNGCFGVRTGSRSMVARSVAIVIVGLLALNSAIFMMRVSAFLGDWVPMHGLSEDFERGLTPVGAKETVVVDDLGAVSVEKFQKTHYVGVIAALKGASVALPAGDDDVLRGGYLRSIAVSTLRSATAPRWLIRLKSEMGARSVFEYPSGSVNPSTEYDLIDLSKAMIPMAAGNGWHGCETAHCWTRERFEVEAFTPADCAATLVLDVSFFAPPPSATLTVERDDGWTRSYPAVAGGLTIPLKAGWSRTAIRANWAIKSPQEIGMSVDARKLFAMVRSVHAQCLPPTTR